MKLRTLKGRVDFQSAFQVNDRFVGPAQFDERCATIVESESFIAV